MPELALEIYDGLFLFRVLAVRSPEHNLVAVVWPGRQGSPTSEIFQQRARTLKKLISK